MLTVYADCTTPLLVEGLLPLLKKVCPTSEVLTVYADCVY
jgi:hypothetical protein